MCSCMFCQRIACLFDFQSTFKTYRSYPNIDERTRTPALWLFCRIGIFKFTKLLISNLKNKSGGVWTTRTKVLLHVSFFNAYHLHDQTEYFIVLSIYLLINFVRYLLALCENKMITFYYWGHWQWHMDVLKFRPTSLFCSNMLFFILDFGINSKTWVTSDTYFSCYHHYQQEWP